MFKKTTTITYQALAKAEARNILPGAFILDPNEGFMTRVVSNTFNDEDSMSTELVPLNPLTKTYESCTYTFPITKVFTIYKKM